MMPPRRSVLEAIDILNELIDAPLLERGFDKGDGTEELPDEGTPAEVAYVLARTMKLAEELGELITAIIDRMALNFRKGRDPDANWGHVADELNDIAATAVLANRALFLGTDVIAELEVHILTLARRAKEAGK